jgi:hypothetical protein
MTEREKSGRWLRPSLAWLTAVCLLALFLLTTTQSAKAHERVEIGPYVVIVGWLVEPPIVGERNAIIVEISEDEQPVTGAEAGLDVELVYGAETFRANLNPTAVPGHYTVDVFPTVRGQYGLRLFGELGETAVDETIEPEEVFPGDRIQFPEPLPDPRQLHAQITFLEAQLQSTRTISYVAVGTAVVALLLAIVSLIRKRQP